MNMTEPLSILAEIAADYEKITDADVKRAARRLGPVRGNETALGKLHADNVKKLWALAALYEARGEMYAVDAKFKADTEEQLAESYQMIARAACLEEVVRDLFWAQAREDIGAPAWLAAKSGDVGLRADWMLVRIPSPPDALRGLIAGIVGLKPEAE